MTIKTKIIILTLCLNIIISWSQIARGEEVIIELLGPSEIDVNSSFNVSLQVTNISSFDAANFDIIFNSKYFRVTNVSDGYLTDSIIPVSMWDLIDQGTLRIIVNIPGLNGVSGSGSLAIIRFTSLSAGTTSINITNMALSNTEALEIPAEWNEYTITILPGENNSHSGSSGGSDNPSTENNLPPIALCSPLMEDELLVGEEIFFNGSLSSDPDGYITSYHWNFGDNTTGNLSQMTHVYTKEGVYNVTLTILDDNGESDLCETMIFIYNTSRVPTAPIVTGPDYGSKGVSYNFTLQSTDPNNDLIQYIIHWNDQVPEISTSSYIESGKPLTINHIWISAGIYTFNVISSDNNSTSKATNFTIFIDTIPIENIGYLIDDDSNGFYDFFQNKTTNQKNKVIYQEYRYLIDNDNDNQWDYYYSSESGLMVINDKSEKDIPGFGIFLILISMLSVLYFFNKFK